MTSVKAKVRSAATVAVTSALEATSAPGARGVLDAVERLGASPQTFTTVQDPAHAATDWLSALDQQVTQITGAADRGRARAASRLVRSVGSGAAALIGASAVGLGAARAALTTFLGDETTAVVDGATADLAVKAAQQADSGAVPARAALASSDLADDAASRLRLRLAVLKDLT